LLVPSTYSHILRTRYNRIQKILNRLSFKKYRNSLAKRNVSAIEKRSACLRFSLSRLDELIEDKMNKPHKTTKNSPTLGIRLSPLDFARLEAIGNSQFIKPRITEVARQALLLGLDALENTIKQGKPIAVPKAK